MAQPISIAVDPSMSGQVRLCLNQGGMCSQFDYEYPTSVFDDGTAISIEAYSNPEAWGTMFAGWYRKSGSVWTFITSSNPYGFTVSSSNSGVYWAKFEAAYLMQVVSGGNGTVSLNGGGTSAYLIAGNTYTVSATPSAGYVFNGWWAGGVKISSSASYQFSMPTAATTYTATFVPAQYTLSASANNGGKFMYNTQSGTQYSSISLSIAFGTSFYLYAVPASYNSFVGWYKSGSLVTSNRQVNITMPSSNVTYTASFSYNSYTLSLLSDGGGQVKINSGAYGSTASASITYASSVTAYALPNSSSKFVGWYQGTTLKSTSPTWTFSMPGGNTSYVAKFKKKGTPVWLGITF